MCFLDRLAEHSSQNKMTKENIAIAFGPSLMESGTEVLYMYDI